MVFIEYLPYVRTSAWKSDQCCQTEGQGFVLHTTQIFFPPTFIYLKIALNFIAF